MIVGGGGSKPQRREQKRFTERLFRTTPRAGASPAPTIHGLCQRESNLRRLYGRGATAGSCLTRSCRGSQICEIAFLGRPLKDVIS